VPIEENPQALRGMWDEGPERDREGDTLSRQKKNQTLRAEHRKVEKSQDLLLAPVTEPRQNYRSAKKNARKRIVNKRGNLEQKEGRKADRNIPCNA